MPCSVEILWDWRSELARSSLDDERETRVMFWAPSSRKRRAMAKPIPDAPPVIKAERLVSVKGVGGILVEEAQR